MDEKVKEQLLKSAEKMTETALDEVIAIAEVYAANTASPIDDGVVNGIKMLKKAFLDDLVNKICDTDGD